jgi:hypothetical protein
MSGPLEELERLSAEARSKKGRMDADSRKQAAALLQLIWTDPAQDPSATLPYLPDLKAEALADAIAQSWPKMDGERRSLFERWLPDPATERDIRRLAFLIGGVLATDPATAIRWLRRLVPPDRKGPTKETRQHLAAGVLDTNLELSGVALETSAPNETLRLYAILWSVATDSAFAVPTMARVRLARAIVAFGRKQDRAPKDSALEHLYSQIRAESASWPTALRNEFELPGEGTEHGISAQPDALVVPPDGTRRADVTADRPEPVTVAETPGSIDASSEGLARAAASPSSSLGSAKAGPESLKTIEKPSDLASGLNARIAGLPAELSLLHGIKAELRRYAEEKQTHELRQQELEEIKREVTELRSALSAAIHERDSGREDLLRERARAQDLAAKLSQLAENAETERRRLAQQISANASGTLEEYKNRLGYSLSRLVRDLPAKHAEVSPELGKILLLQFHQFLDALRQDGIAVRAGDGPQ